MQSFVDQIAIAKQRPAIDNYYININQFIADAIEKTLVGNKNPKDALDEAAAKSNELLKK
jgi:maltose-binding protein MalE